MTALDDLKVRGLMVRLKGSRVSLAPKELISSEVQVYIRTHRLMLAIRACRERWH